MPESPPAPAPFRRPACAHRCDARQCGFASSMFRLAWSAGGIIRASGSPRIRPAPPFVPRREASISIEISTRMVGEIAIMDLKGRATLGKDTDKLNDALRDLVAGGARRVLVNLASL